jgi:nucleoside phosphorylase
MNDFLVLAPTHEEFLLMSKVLPSKCKLVEIGVGKAAAAASTALETQVPYKQVFLIGFCGSPYLPLGTISIPSQTFYHDSYVPVELQTELTQKYDLPGSDGPILTADSFVTPELCSRLVSAYSKDIFYDMEAAAVAQICAWTNSPLSVIKMVSDNPSTNYIDFVSTNPSFSPFSAFIESYREA